MVDGRRHFWDDWSPEEIAAHFRYYTPAQLIAWEQRRGLDIECTDPDTLRRAAAIEVRAMEQADGEAPAPRARRSNKRAGPRIVSAA